MTVVESVSARGMLRLSGISVTADIEWLDPSQVGDLERLLAKVLPTDTRQIPRQRGFCLGHGTVQDPYEHLDTESIALTASLPGHPDVNISFTSMSGTTPAPGLLERNAKAAEREPILTRLAFTSLRKGRRAINGLEGEELLLRVREPNLRTGYSFQWEAPGKRNDVHAPLLTLEIESGTNPVSGGRPMQSSLSEAQMSALWQTIVRSIRLRPVKAAVSPAQPSGAAPGA